MKKSTGRTMALLGLCLSLVGGTAWARQQVTRPWKVSGDVVATVDLSHIDEGYAPWVAAEVGVASHLGRYTLQAEGVNNFVAGENLGQGIMIAANGDALFFETEAIADTTAVMNVIGGTGRFEGATGSITMTYTPTEVWDWLNMVMTMTYSYAAQGTITY